MKNNLGKVFEQNLQSYAKKDGIFCMRIQDSDLSFAGGNSKFTNPSLCDFIMFYKNHLFAVECKSTKYKSFSIDLGQDAKGAKMIKAHQIHNLINCNTYDNIEGVFIFNFRIEDNDAIIDEHTYILNIENFSNFISVTGKLSINEQDIIDFGGIQCNQEKKRKYFTYDVKTLFDDYLEEVNNNVSNDIE